ncbi:RNA polymerase sigma factor [Pseudomonas sp. H9]|uniref:RNA polymerase sigma factor n=1 Tax=Pseudomonas sp. H9 TaxID=483968 RepID=UPI00105838D9|nr:sigma-70 family RNA polymerase sigma factor [Pseudomonas sp. H9]TDF82399.1 sigma-70 family RNA polymerase sigma factor [Pseudomonas sp. H9]
MLPDATKPVVSQSSLIVPIALPSAPVSQSPSWQDIDLRWAYNDLLLSLSRQTRCVQRAYDVLHDALLRFALATHPQPLTQPNAYLRQVAQSVLIDHFRRNARLQPLPEEHEQDGDLHVTPSAEHLLDIQQRLIALQRILDCLPARCREVFWLARIEGYAQKDIAQQLDISLNMVERHMARALVTLRNARDLLRP